ncbi:MAG TPA: VOC family protein, partial [Rhodoglobus sp.]|nr:VOC family protein [Rhodoglobus sp.]
PSDAFSLMVSVETQDEVDRYWNALTADGGEESQCGWLKDKYGISWQIIPTALGRLIGDPNRARAGRAMQAMFAMRKIVIADLEAAAAG